MSDLILHGNIKRARLDPVAVLADRYSRNVVQTWVYVAPIIDKKMTSKLVKELSAKFPLDHLQHLKRVRNVDNLLEIILCKDGEDIGAVSKFEGIDKTKIRKQAVSLYSPCTRLQFEESCLLWPTQFHEDKEIRQTLDGSIFNALDTEKINGFMRIAIAKAIEIGKVDANIVLVVNPKTDRVLSIGTSCISENPALHATIVALDLIAQQQGGGAWKIAFSKLKLETDAQLLCVDDDCNYLCTGYDVYLLREPCAMCAMALVHSRIRRAFYGVSDLKHGSLGSRFKIHCLGGLNHSFQVWKNVLSDECHAALCGDFKHSACEQNSGQS